jgi:transcription-repair coupling factor (superfamily II helicase)
VPEVRLLPGREFPMDEAARTALPQPLARALRGRPDQAPRLYKDIGNGIASARHRVLPAAVLRRDGHALRLPRREAPRGAAWRRRRRPLRSFLAATRRERHRFLQHDPERPVLPPDEPCSCGAEQFFAATQPHWPRCALTRAGEPRTLRLRPLPHAGGQRAAPQRACWRALEPLACTAHATAACCCVAESDGRRESLLELPARPPASDLPQRRLRWRTSWPATMKLAHRAAPLASGLPLAAAEAGIDPCVTETELFAADAATRAPRASRSRSATSTR